VTTEAIFYQTVDADLVAKITVSTSTNLGHLNQIGMVQQG
jgi:hypothetical protein